MVDLEAGLDRLLDPVVFEEFQTEVRDQWLELKNALNDALKNWTELQRYLRTGNGKVRFPTVSKQMLDKIDARRQAVLLCQKEMGDGVDSVPLNRLSTATGG